VKVAKSSIRSRKRSFPEIKFEDQKLTSFAGLVVFQKLFETLDLAQDLKNCCKNLKARSKHFYQFSDLLQLLIVHLLLGYRSLRELDFYREDPLVKDFLKLNHLPSVPTLSRMLGEFDDESLAAQQALNRRLILDRVTTTDFTSLTLDFDGSVLSTKRHAEKSAVGFNKTKKGARSYYPLFCTVAQTGQIFDYHHRSGNVHDSNGAKAFVIACVSRIREAHSRAHLEVRMDSAFFSDELVGTLEELKVQYTISVPFERFVELKGKIAAATHWQEVGGCHQSSQYFEESWKPKSWEDESRFLFVRREQKLQQKGPLQLDLFEPMEYEHCYKVILTNKKTRAGAVISYHEGRGYQERIFGEIKGQLQMGYIPCKRVRANKIYLNCSILAHNLSRELQMRTTAMKLKETMKRTARWTFQEASTLRRTIIQRAGRLTRPQGKLTLTLNMNHKMRDSILRFMKN